MKAKKKFGLKISVCLLAVLLLAISITVIMASASETIEVVGEMVDIKTKFSSYLVQDTIRKDDGGYVGDHQYTVYYDTSKGAVKTGYEGTPVIIYTINHPGIDRIGTDDNETIISSMLEKGYVVIVLDYLNNPAAISPAIESSTQAFRTDLRNGKILKTSEILPSGSYHENFLVPSGYNVLLNQVFWEIDKHSTEGTLEKIVENWNSDFRATKGDKLLKWVHSNGERKAVQADFDGNAPKWYDSTGKEDKDGEYTYVKFTQALTITDCVDPDGSFIDMNLYINIVYPTSPENEVPVMALANSSGYPTTSVTGADLRPHSNGFLYNGYAGVVFDYLWVPMARNASWGYYDGSAGVTQDHMNYAVMMYNDKLVNTAAMRYLRYTSLSGGKTYNFDLDAFGVYGNSKGGWFSYLGEAILQSNLVDASKYQTTEALEDAITDALAALIPDRYYNGQHGETRYQVGAGTITADGFTVKAGTVQPWLTYNGKEILSGCQLTNACNGSQEEDITAGHSPVFISGNMTDTYNAAYSYSVNIHNICKNLNIPLLHFEVPIGHTLTSGMDMNYNVDTYDAYFRYIGYYLKGDAISVAYVSPMNKEGEVKITDKIKIGFAGATTLANVQKITLTAGTETVAGTWESSYGGTVWTFIPENLSGNTTYTLTIPADFAGTNGVKMEKAYTTTFTTEYDNATQASASGDYYTLTAPAFTGGNGFVFRFRVANDAANIANLYAVSAIGETNGELLGSVNLRGAGSYEIDISDYIAKKSGENIVLYLTGAKAAGKTTVTSNNFDSAELDKDTFSKGSKAVALTAQSIAGKTAVGVYIKTPTQKDVSVYYDNVTTAFTYKYIVGSSAPKAQDLGRRYTISFDVYDTIDRVIKINLNSMTKREDYGTIDYDNVYFNVKTQAGKWTTVSFTYEVYEPDYGFPSAIGSQSLSISMSPSGDTNKIAYFDNLLVIETVTDIDVSSAYVAEKKDSAGSYTAPISTSPFAVYNGSTKVGDYAGWAAAINAYKSGYTIKLQRNYTLTDADLTDNLGSFAAVNIDLGTYTLTAANTKNSLIWAKATSTSSTVINITGGDIRLGRTPLITYEGATESGKGKTFNINFTDTYIGFANNAWCTEIISGTIADFIVKSNISFTNCTLEFDDDLHAKDASTIFTAPADNLLAIQYTISGGQLKLRSQRWITILTNAKIVEFKKGASGDYMTLLMPESETTAINGTYMCADGYSSYEKASVANNIVTYKLIKGENSTKYGVITSTYTNADEYPLILFKDGVMVSAHKHLADAITAAKDILGDAKYANAQAEILLRKNLENSTEPTYGYTAGTLLIDLGGKTLTRGSVIINATVKSNTPMFETNVIFTNGRLETKKDVIGVTHALYTTSSVKVYNITFNDVTFGFAPAATEVSSSFWKIWQNNHNTIIETNLTFKDCVFDLDNNKPSKTGSLFTLKSADNDCAECNIVIDGGEIIGNGDGITLFAKDSKDSVVLKKNSSGSYLKFTPIDNGKPVVDNFLCDDGKYRNFQASGSGYSLEENDLVTPYGVITSEYENYTFVVFKENGDIIGGYNYLYGNNGDSKTSAWGAAKEHVKSNQFNVETGKFTVSSYHAYIVMRNNYEFQLIEKDGKLISEYTDNIAQVRGAITLDLGGHVLSQDSTNTEARSMFQATSKAWGTVTNSEGTSVSYNFPSIYNIKNGTLKANKSSIIKHGVNSNSSALKVFTFNFDNVTFALTDDATTNNLLVSYGASNYAAGLDINLNNCTFDLNTKKPTQAITLVNPSCTPAKVRSSITLRATTFLIDNFNNITIFGTEKTSNVSVKFLEDDNGRLATLNTLSSNTPYANYIVSDEGNRYFVERKDDGTKSTYYLESIATAYGTPTHSTIKDKPGYLSALDYPFFVFQNGVLKFADETYALAISHVKDLAKGSASINKTAEIVLRRDYTVQKKAPRLDGTTSEDTTWNLLYMIGGTMTVDLNGYSLIRNDKPILDISSKTDEDLAYKTTIVIKNGNVVVSGGQIMGVDHGGITKATTKVWDITFENITMSYAKGSTAKTMIAATWTSGKGYSTLMNLNLTNCVIDMTNAPTGVTLINASDERTNESAGNVDYTTIFNGCTIVGYASLPTIFTSNAGDNIFFDKYNGEYLTISLPETTARPTTTFTSTKGISLEFGKELSSGDRIIYGLGEPIYTKYGYITYRYHLISEYTFVVFDEKGNCIGGDNSFLDTEKEFDDDGAINIAKDYLSANTWKDGSYGENPKAAFILMRSDYIMASNESYNNISQVQGTLTINLNGFTLTAPESKPIIPGTVKPWAGSGTGDSSIFPSEFIFENGNVVIRNSALVSIEAWTGDANRSDDYVAGKKLSFDFINVNIKVSGNTQSLAAKYNLSKTPNAIAYTYMSFTDCTFDITDAVNNIVLFNTGTDKIHNSITITGGEIISNNASFVMSSSTASNAASVLFTKTDGGNYTTLTLPLGINAPTNRYKIAAGEAVFVKVAQNNETTTYRLRQVELADITFAPKMSLTLDRDLIINVYVPAKSLVKFTVNGDVYTDLDAISELKTTLDDGDYYQISVTVPAKDALNGVILTATVTVDEINTATGKFDLNIVNYAKKILGDENEVETQLMLDILSYVRAAYTYFKMDYNDAAIAEIDNILGENYDAENAPEIEGSNIAPTEGLEYATFVLNATPAIRFYIESGKDASQYAFYANGVKLSTEIAENKEYIDIDVYAYRMCETITYTINGEEAGSFHIRCYYEWALGENDDALVNIVSRFWKYCQSARAYKNSVVTN